MTGPEDPDDEDWGFPEVDPAGPASVQLPEPEPEPEVVYDTGSDAWWRAQAQAQRRAAESDPVVPPTTPTPPAPVAPPEIVESQVLRPEPPPSPLDSTWLPPDLPAQAEPVRPPAPPVPPVPPVPPALPVPPIPPAPPAPPVAAAPPRIATRPTPPAPVAPPPPAPLPPAVPVAVDPPVRPVEASAALPPGPDRGGDSELPDDSGPSIRAPYEGQPIGPGKAVAGAAIAVAGVALGIGALLLFNKGEPKGTPTVASPPSASASASPTPQPTSQPTPSATVPVVAPPPTAAASPTLAQVVPITVLNNSRIQHLADRAAARFQSGGWPVPHKGNYRGGIISKTTVYYAPDQLASAQRFATQFGIGRVLPRFAGLPGSGVTVVLTRDYH